MAYLGAPPLSPGIIGNTSQIADGVIQTADIGNNAITSGKLDTNISIAGTLGVGSNLTVTGNLQVQGTTTSITSASAQTVDLGDNDKIRLGDTNDLEIYHDGSNSIINDGGTGNLQLATGGTVKLAITSTGATITGGATVTGAVEATEFNATSDITLKEDLVLVSNPLEKISKLSGYTFNWKDTKKESVGIVAQEVEAIFPQMVSTGQDGYKRVNYDALIPVMIEAIKDLKRSLDSK